MDHCPAGSQRIAGSVGSDLESGPVPLLVNLVVMDDGGPAVLNVAGEVDLLTAGLLRTRLEEASQHSVRVVVDLSEVTFIDSSGLNVLVEAYLRAGQLPEAFVLRSPTPTVARVLSITGLADVLTIESAASIIATRPMHSTIPRASIFFARYRK